MNLTQALDFSGQQVLVCGGSDGIGYGIARAFEAAGANVAITGTKDRAQYDQNFTGLTYYRLDVQDAHAITQLANCFSTLNVLVNSAGAVLWKKAEFEREGFEKILSINLSGAMQLCTEFHDHLAASGGSIVHVDSVASLSPAVNNPAYSASKAGLVQLTKALAKKWGADGIRVNTIAPGMVPTKMTKNQSSPEQIAAFSKINPIGRYGTPDDMAGAALFLASPLASYVTGQQLVVDGGLSI